MEKIDRRIGQRRDATRAPSQARSGARPSGRLLVCPLHHLKTAEILSKQWGPLQVKYLILRGRGWSQCTNRTAEHLVVYGQKHECERSIFDTSPYVLLPGATTPDNWDCDCFFLPSDRLMRRWRGYWRGPLAVKFWNHRRFEVSTVDPVTYHCSWDNGVFEPSQINWTIPNFSYAEIMRRLDECGITV